MPVRKAGPVEAGTSKSVVAAVADGTIDPAISAGPVAILLVLARRVDLDSDRDTVSVPAYLRACEALRLTPSSRVEKKAGQPVGKLASIRSLRSGA